MEWMILPLKRYADFSGRSRRMEFWMWVLFTVIVGFVLGLIDGVAGMKFGTAPADPAALRPGGVGMAAFSSIGVLGAIWSLATLIPNIAVAVRRLHDIDRTGWWILLPVAPYILGAILMISAVTSGSYGMMGLGGVLMLIGFVCAIVLLVFYCLPGTRGPNRFGPDPLGDLGNLDDTFA